jgi:thiosulfate/3-mercaptopyruvate sulfurtransferase
MNTLLVAVLLAAPVPLAPGGEDGFDHPELLVSTEWVGQNFAAANVRIVDVRSLSDYSAGHLPTAISVPVEETFDPQAPSGTVASPEALAGVLGKRGIGRDDHVILYDAGRSTKAARVFWTLEYYGHPNVSVLDGGIARWEAEKREVTGVAVKPSQCEYELEVQDARLSTVDRLMERPEKAAVLDVRSDREWNAGRIPGAIHIDWMKNFNDDEAPVLRSPAALRELYADVPRDVDVHAY